MLGLKLNHVSKRGHRSSKIMVLIMPRKWALAARKIKWKYIPCFLKYIQNIFSTVRMIWKHIQHLASPTPKSLFHKFGYCPGWLLFDRTTKGLYETTGVWIYFSKQVFWNRIVWDCKYSSHSCFRLQQGKHVCSCGQYPTFMYNCILLDLVVLHARPIGHGRPCLEYEYKRVYKYRSQLWCVPLCAATNDEVELSAQIYRIGKWYIDWFRCYGKSHENPSNLCILPSFAVQLRYGQLYIYDIVSHGYYISDIICHQYCKINYNIIQLMGH